MRSPLSTLRSHEVPITSDASIGRQLHEQHLWLIKRFSELQVQLISLESKLEILEIRRDTRGYEMESRQMEWIMMIGSVALYVLTMCTLLFR